MAKATEVANGISTVVQLVKLPSNSRTRTSYTITTTAEAAANATTLAVSATGVKLYKGDKLTFGAVTATLTADAAAGVTSLAVAALSGIIASAATATTYGALTLTSADASDFSQDGKAVDISSFGDAIDTDSIKVQVDHSLKLSGIYVGAHPAVVLLDVLAGTAGELYFIVTDGQGCTVEGVAMVEKFSTTIKLRDIKKFDASLKVVGGITKKDAAGVPLAI
jgi:hypothetical protein